MPAEETSFDEIAEAVIAVKKLQDLVGDLLQAVRRLDERVEVLESDRVVRG